jgi:hypothetical protein
MLDPVLIEKQRSRLFSRVLAQVALSGAVSDWICTQHPCISPLANLLSAQAYILCTSLTLLLRSQHVPDQMHVVGLL